MAEMTAEEAIENLRRRDEDEPRLAVALYAHVADKIAALIEKQEREIARLEIENKNFKDAWTLQEIRAGRFEQVKEG